VPRRLGQALIRPQIPEPTEADEGAGEPEQRAVDVGAPLIADQEASSFSYPGALPAPKTAHTAVFVVLGRLERGRLIYSARPLGAVLHRLPDTEIEIQLQTCRRIVGRERVPKARLQSPLA
jgi:hypothetical protein